MTAQLNWALLSTARITRALIPPLQSSERNVLRAVASRDLATAEAFAAKNGIPQAYGSYEALLADPAEQARLGQAARRAAEGEFSWRRQADYLEAAYRRVSGPVGQAGLYPEA